MRLATTLMSDCAVLIKGCAEKCQISAKTKAKFVTFFSNIKCVLCWMSWSLFMFRESRSFADLWIININVLNRFIATILGKNLNMRPDFFSFLFKTHSFHFIILYLLDRWPQDNSIWQFRNDSIMTGGGGGGVQDWWESRDVVQAGLGYACFVSLLCEQTCKFLLHLFFFFPFFWAVIFDCLQVVGQRATARLAVILIFIVGFSA